MSATPADLSALIDAAAGRPILVVGDVMLDHFVIGRVDRISPEAPVPVVCFEQEEYRLGGAANVAHNVAALGGSVELARRGRRRRAGRAPARGPDARAGVGTTALVTDPARCTTRKLRVVTTRNQQVARIDYESDREVTGGLQDGPRSGGARPRRRRRRRRALRLPEGRDHAGASRSRRSPPREARGVPVLVDPKVPHVDYYAAHRWSRPITTRRKRSR